jgi:hypothetical protein
LGLVLIILALINLLTRPEFPGWPPVVQPQNVANSGFNDATNQHARPADTPNVPDDHPTQLPFREDAASNSTAQVGVEPLENEPPIQPSDEPAQPEEEAIAVPAPLEPETNPPRNRVAGAEGPITRKTSRRSRGSLPSRASGLNLRGPGDGRKPPAKLPPQLGQLLNSITLAVGREVEDTAKRSKLKFDADQKPVLILQPDMQAVAPNIVLTLRAELTVEDESGQTIKLWENEAELASFLPSANPTVVLGNARTTIGRFFRDFREKYDAAVANTQRTDTRPIARGLPYISTPTS